MSLRKLWLVLVLASGAAQAADETLVLSPVYSSSVTDRQSYLRLVNLGTAAGKVTAVVKDDQGRSLGTWTKDIAANTAPQVGMAEVEAALSAAPAASNLRLEITSNFYGYVQHAVWNPQGGALTNLSNCGIRAVSDVHTLSNVHTTLLKGTYPSTIVIANRGASAGPAAIEVYDAGTGAKLGSYTSPSVAAGGHAAIPEETLEQAINLKPSPSQFHLTLKLTGTFQGSMAHLVDNFGAGVITDMTQRCVMRGIPTDTYATRSLAGKMSMIGFYAPINEPSPQQIVPWGANVRLGQEQRQGIIFGGFKFDTLPKTESTLKPVDLLLLEQKVDGNLQIATSTYVSTPTTNGFGRVIAADFNGDGKEDIFLAAQNEHPNVATESTVYMSKSDGTFNKVMLGDAIHGHGVTLRTLNGKPTVLTAGPGPGQSLRTYVSDGVGGFVQGTALRKVGSAIFEAYGVTGGDFLGNGQTQFLYTDAYTKTNDAYGTPPKNYVSVLFPLENNLVAGTPTLLTPILLPSPYFNDKPQYASATNIWDSFGAKTHDAGAFSYDLNNDGMLDALVQGSIFPGAPFPGAEFASNRPIGTIQVLQNRGGGNFTDETDKLNPEWSVYAGVDEAPTFVTDDSGGLLAIISQQSGVQNSAKVYFPGTTGNTIFLNDGTGRLHLVLQDEMVNFATQIEKYMATQNPGITGLGSGGFTIQSIRMFPYKTVAGNFNFMGYEILLDRRFIMANAPLDLNLTVDFRKDITITDRNGSKRIRTFGGNDVINKKAGDPDAVIDGGVGRDKVVYSGNRSGYTITKGTDGNIRIKDNAAGGTTDTLINIETAQFADGSIDLY